MRRNFRRLIDDRSGVTAIEYAVISSLIAIAILVGATLTGTNLNQTFVTIDVALGSSAGGSGDHDGH
jgi:pilus assembly protein Flp/PilA